MNVYERVQAAVAARIAATAALAELGVFDAPPVRGAMPYAVVDTPVLADWSTKDWEGREGRLAVTLHDAGERPVRLRAMLAALEQAVETLEPVLGGGWRVVRLRLARSRLARAGADRWIATSEFAVRFYREN